MVECTYAEFRSCLLSLMMSAMLNVVMQNVVMLIILGLYYKSICMDFVVSKCICVTRWACDRQCNRH